MPSQPTQDAGTLDYLRTNNQFSDEKHTGQKSQMTVVDESVAQLKRNFYLKNKKPKSVSKKSPEMNKRILRKNQLLAQPASAASMTVYNPPHSRVDSSHRLTNRTVANQQNLTVF